MSDRYLIWSHEHSAWWAPECQGYTPRLSLAGRYSREVALDICACAIPGSAQRHGALQELPVREADAEAMVEAYNAKYSSRPKPEVWE